MLFSSQYLTFFLHVSGVTQFTLLALYARHFVQYFTSPSMCVIVLSILCNLQHHVRLLEKVYGFYLNVGFHQLNPHLFHFLTKLIIYVFLFLFRGCYIVFCVFSSFWCVVSLAIHFFFCVSSSSLLLDVILCNC